MRQSSTDNKINHQRIVLCTASYAMLQVMATSLTLGGGEGAELCW